MVRENMRSPRAVLHSSNLLRVATSGWVSMLGSTPRLAPSPPRHHSTFLSPFTKENRVISVRRTRRFLPSIRFGRALDWVGRVILQGGYGALAWRLMHQIGLLSVVS